MHILGTATTDSEAIWWRKASLYERWSGKENYDHIEFIWQNKSGEGEQKIFFKQTIY